MMQGTPSGERHWTPRPEVLLLSGSHGIPPTQGRFARGAELARELTLRGCVVDWVLLVERRLEYIEEDEMVALRSSVRDLQIVDHPALGSAPWRLAARVLERLGLAPAFGGRWSTPRTLLRFLRSFIERRRHDVVVCGAQMARALRLFAPGTIRILDVPRLESESLRDHVAGGRADGLASLPDAEREMRLLAGADAVLVACQEDAVTLRARGFCRDLLLVPPMGLLVAPPGVGRAVRPALPPAPPHVLFVGSDTTANLDGLRWFRKEVLPRLARVVPTSRLRVVGEVSRHIDPDPRLDRMGRVENLEEEYAACAAVILPLRLGSGIRRRAVEALVRGKVLCATSKGAVGTGVTHGRNAIVSDDPQVLAEELGRVLSSDSLRRALEGRALRLGRERFASPNALDPLARFLCLPAPLDLARAELVDAAVP
jgi:glycosyltransferase involved in cell wall biosynthesis